MFRNCTILVDQDGVLANYSKRLIEIALKEYPEEREVREEDLTLFDTDKHFSHGNQKAIDRIALREGFFASLEPIDGAVAAMHDLLTLGFDVRICTAPKKVYTFCVPEKMAWIEKHLGREFALRTIITRDKTLVRGNILIDDKPEISGIAKPEWEHILHDRPYNRAIALKRRLSWKNYREVLGIE